MYLASLTNIDYIIITILFAILFMVAYSFRRKNETVSLFLFSSKGENPEFSTTLTNSYGVIEIVLAGAAGAICGVNAIFYFAIGVLISYMLANYVAKNIYPKTLFQYIGDTFNHKAQSIFAIICGLFLLFLSLVTVIFTFKLLQALLGWRFINSVFGIMIFTLIYILIGGSRAIKYNSCIQIGVIFIGFAMLLIIGLLKLGGLPSIIVNLQELAINKGMPKGYFTSFNLNFNWYLLGIVIMFFSIIPFILLKMSSQKIINGLSYSLGIILMIMVGIIAIATPVWNKNRSSDQIITLRTQLPDGQTGYIIKSIKDGMNKVDIPPGIIPPVLNPETNLVEANKYDYFLSSVVPFRYYLPKEFLVTIVLIILCAFMLSISQYLINISRLIVYDIYARFGWLAEYGEIGKLWLARMTIIFAGGISLFGAHLIEPYINMITVINSIGIFVSLIFIFILAAILYAKIEKK